MEKQDIKWFIERYGTDGASLAIKMAANEIGDKDNEFVKLLIELADALRVALRNG